MFTTEPFKPVIFFGAGEIYLNGKTVKYNTVSEDNVLYDEKGEALASVFSFSYFKADVDDLDDRPVIFAFNGGPGSSSCMLHTGFLGPKRIRYEDDIDAVSGLPPYDVIDNPECILDVADIVLVDPVSTGFGLLLDENSSARFFGIKEDAEAFLCFMQCWLQKYGRWNSPKYIIAESYGCTRAVMAAELATGPGTERCYDFMFDGLIMIGSTVTTGQYFNVGVPVEKSVLSFPTYAANNWYHNTNHDVPLEAWIKSAREFAENDYLLALFKGDRLQGSEREKIKERIKYFTGVSDGYLENRHLRIDSYSVKNEVMRKKGKVISRLDGRITRNLYATDIEEDRFGMTSDAARGKYNSIFLGTLISKIFPLLGIKDFGRVYRSAIKISSKWNKNTDLTTAECLSNAMKRSPGLRVFFANGYYDLTTEIGLTYYMLDHADLPHDRVFMKGYPAGHMIYLGNSGIKLLSDDVRRFICGNNG